MSAPANWNVSNSNNEQTLTTNPYAIESIQPPGFVPQPPDLRNAIYQQNGLLIMHKMATLPDRCIKSNEPTNERLKRTLYWHHPAVYLVILLNLLIYAIVALAVRKSAVIHFPLAKRFKKRRIRNMIIAWSIVLFGLLSMVVGIMLADGNQAQPWHAALIVAFPFSLLVGALWGIIGCRVVYAKKIDDQFVWIAGVSPEYLAQFPSP